MTDLPLMSRYSLVAELQIVNEKWQKNSNSSTQWLRRGTERGSCVRECSTSVERQSGWNGKYKKKTFYSLVH
jgi:hypothetical protein